MSLDRANVGLLPRPDPIHLQKLTESDDKNPDVIPCSTYKPGNFLRLFVQKMNALTFIFGLFYLLELFFHIYVFYVFCLFCLLELPLFFSVRVHLLPRIYFYIFSASSSSSSSSCSCSYPLSSTFFLFLLLVPHQNLCLVYF